MRKAVNTISLAIGLSPVLASGANQLPSGNVHGFFNDLIDGYSGGVAIGANLDTAKLARWYGPIVVAILFKKAMKHLHGKTLLG